MQFNEINAHVTGIIIDKDALDVVNNYFGLIKLNNDERLSMHIGSGFSTTSESSNDNEVSRINEIKRITIITLCYNHNRC